MNGAEMMALAEELYPLCRSITGDGVRETLRTLGRWNPVEIVEVPTGSPACDWVVPREWNLREAWVKSSSGEKVVDLADSTLHVVGYSVPVHEKLSRAELDAHLHSIPEHPSWIPWRNSYYEEGWGFCLPHAQRAALPDEEYEVYIDASLEDGHLSYGELFLPGRRDEELLVSVHVCHPSLANDNLSGIAVSTAVASMLAGRDRTLGVRFLYVPGTIGSLAWLERNRERTGRVVGGLTLTCLGDAAGLTYKRSFAGDADVDRVAKAVLADRAAQGLGESELIDFYPYGYDERQYNAPAFRMPVGSLMRSRHGRFDEYHSSADDLSLLSVERLEEARDVVLEILGRLDRNRRYRSLAPEGEPQLGRRGIYRALGGGGDPAALQYAMLWLLQCGDGSHSLLDVAERSEMPFGQIADAADLLEEHALIDRS